MMRPALLACGLMTVAGIWLGPLPALASQYFAAHMVMHMGVVAIVAPLVAAGLAGTSADPTVRWPRVFSAIPAAMLELVIVWAWHTPALHHAARTTTSGLVCEQSLFFAASVFLWISVLGSGNGRGRTQRLMPGVTALLLTTAHMTLLGALLALSPRVLYSHAADPISAAARLDDQHLGGAIMLVVGGVSYLAGGVWLAAQLLQQRIRERPTTARWSRT
jgi:putative membrane protein